MDRIIHQNSNDNKLISNDDFIEEYILDEDFISLPVLFRLVKLSNKYLFNKILSIVEGNIVM